MAERGDSPELVENGLHSELPVLLGAGEKSSVAAGPTRRTHVSSGLQRDDGHTTLVLKSMARQRARVVLLVTVGMCESLLALTHALSPICAQVIADPVGGAG
ncbi:hypothetical protein [Streptoalloteichus hindustanus]|uniref:hypothetical protein n=1 Tax=Streptoalloteichus hindustanus TaxID=2017 RepID=UPI000937E1FC|nr:hypothetical protein [Streptoalloteichus hindustanus]